MYFTGLCIIGVGVSSGEGILLRGVGVLNFAKKKVIVDHFILNGGASLI